MARDILGSSLGVFGKMAQAFSSAKISNKK
jgi:hypothetical protein